MKINVDKETLSEKLSMVQGIAEKRATMPILSHVLISPQENGIQITATDLETTLSVECEATADDKKALALPARKLFDIVRELPEGELKIEEIKNNWVEITTSSAAFKLAGLPADDFPVVPEVSTDNIFEIDSETLENMISKTIYCVSGDELRRNLSGIYFEKLDGKKLRLVATDGHRLSYVEKELENDVVLNDNVLVPRKAVSELRRLLKYGEKLQIGCEKNFFITVTNGIKLFSRLIDADFPDYNQVVPKSTKSKIVLNRDQLLSALKRVSLLSSEKTRSVKMNLSSNSLTLSSVSPDVGEARESLPLKFDGGDLEIGFNARYLLDILESIDEEDIDMELTDELSPTVLKPLDSTDYLCVVMPMRV